MKLKKLEVLNKGNAVSKLTVTPSRVTIKLAKDLSPELTDRILMFLTPISETNALKNIENTVRGNVEFGDDGKMFIILRNDSKKHSYVFDEE